MMNKFSCPLNLPVMLGKHESKNMEILYVNIPNKDLRLKQHDNSYLGAAKYERLKAQQYYTDYFLNILPEFEGHIIEIGFQTISNFHNIPEGAQLPAHTDGKRGTHCISYIFTTGGDGISTTWYQEKNESLIRKPNIFVTDASKLIQLEKTIFLPEQWCILQTNVLHSVQPIADSRYAFTVGFSNQKLYETIIEKYGIKNTSF